MGSACGSTPLGIRNSFEINDADERIAFVPWNVWMRNRAPATWSLD